MLSVTPPLAELKVMFDAVLQRTSMVPACAVVVGPLVEFLKCEGPVIENEGLPIRCYQGALCQYLANDHRTILLRLKKPVYN